MTVDSVNFPRKTFLLLVLLLVLYRHRQHHQYRRKSFGGNGNEEMTFIVLGHSFVKSIASIQVMLCPGLILSIKHIIITGILYSPLQDCLLSPGLPLFFFL